MRLQSRRTPVANAAVWAVSTAVAVVLASGLASAQSGRSTISGVVRDSSEGAISLADVIATEEETGRVTTSYSDVRGFYALLNVSAGTYTVDFRKDGFAPFVQKGVRVGVQAAISVDATLTVGTVSSAVTVTADAPLLDSRNAEIGTALRHSVVTNLPLSITGGRSLENFAYAIVPSVEGNNWASNIAGAAPFTKEVILDGTSATIQIQGHVSESSPPMEAVEEFKVETSGIPAEYGRTGGGIFNLSLRSGANTFHGSAYGQLRNEVLDANTWMNNYLGASHPSEAAQYRKPLDRQQLGGTSVGGPIVASRTFYFASFEEYHQNQQQLGAFDRTVPTAAFLSGDLSALLDKTTVLGTDAAGNPIYKGAIIDRLTGRIFPNNLIPSNRISPISQQIVNIYMRSYAPLVPGAVSNNSAGPASVNPVFRQHQFSLKVDHVVSDRTRLSGSMIWTSRPRTLADQGGVWDQADPMGGPLAKSREQDVTTHQARLGHNHAFSPTLLHEATVTFGRFRNPSTSNSAGGDWPKQLGLNVPGAFGSFPQINFGDSVNGIGESNIGYGISDFYVTNAYQYNEALSWVKGRHVVKLGGDVRLIQMNSHSDRAYLTYNFSPIQTGVQSGPFANQVGSGFASFLLGDVASASMNVPSDLYGRRNYESLFVQDDYRIANRVTLNVGLRWETTGPWREKHGHWVNFNVNALNPVTGVPGVVQYADSTNGSFEGTRDLREFGPRIGLAYRASERLVFRSAYGIFYAPIGVNYWQGVPYGFAPGFVGTNTVQPTADGSPAFNWSQTAYPGTLVPAVQSPTYSQWGMVSISPDSLKAGRIQQWNAGVEYELARDFVVGANYLGNRGTRLQSGDLQRNQPNPAAMQQLLLSGKEWNWISDASSAAAAGVPYPYVGFAGAAWMAITPFPQAAAGWGPLFFVGSPLGRSDYKAVQLTANKRTSRGVTAFVGYTLSRQRGDMDSGFQERWWSGPIQDVTRLGREASVIGSNDRPHLLKGFVAWSLPFAVARRFVSTASGITNAIVSGWNVSAIARYESGLPLAITSSNSYAGWMYPIYVNRNPDVSLGSDFDGSHFNPSNPADRGNQYFNPAAFSNPAYGALGTGPGRFERLRSLGGANEDVAVLKDVRVGHFTAQLRFEIFNVFNRRYFADPVADIASPYFGQIISAGSHPPRQGQLGLRLQW